MAVAQEMAVRREVIRGFVKRGWWLSILAFLLFLPVAHADLPNAKLLETDWRTGELEIKWENATPGTTMFLYTATHENQGSYDLHDVWSVNSSSGSYVTQFLENGQTVWYYVRLYDPVTDTWSPPSNIQKQTPPETVFVINWPDMLNDLKDAISQSDQNMQQFINNLVTPSDQAIDDLKNAIDDLKNAVGAGQATNTGTGLVNGINGMQPGMSPPLRDDGNGTYTGGSTGGQLPSSPHPVTGGGMDLNAPNPDSGTDGEMTIRIPYGVDMQGNLLYVKLFTQEQMEKLKWMGLLRTLFVSIIYIMFGVWLVARFSPSLKS